MSASIETGLSIREDNEPGVLSEVASLVSEVDVNIEGIAASAQMDRGWVHLFVNNPGVAKRTLKVNGFNVRQVELIVIEIPDDVGALARITEPVAENDIDILTVYATVLNGEAKVVLQTSANGRALELIREQI